MSGAMSGTRAVSRSILGSRTLWICAGIWIATRAYMVADVGFWGQVSHLRLQDVGNYATWSQHLVTMHSIPTGNAWQYPPAAAYLMLVPRLGPGSYGESFVGLMLLFDLAGLVLLASFGRRSGSYTGVWVWLLGMPLLGTFSVLRFDLVPTVIAIAALVVIHRRPGWFGALAGLGASVKVWPVVLLFGEWDPRRLLRAAAAASGVLALVFLVGEVAFGDPLSFLSGQSRRGLQEEAVATVPWHLWEVVSGHTAQREIRFGAWELTSGGAKAVAAALEWMTLVALAGAVAWWQARLRAIRSGRLDLAEAAVSRDFVFAVVLLLIVTSRVLSSQYMVWLLGMAVVVLTAGSTRLARPAWIVIGAMILTTSTFKSPEHVAIRDLALLAATVDAAVALILALRRAPASAEPGVPEDSGQPMPARV
jgi:hypothetical protein